MYDIIVIGGGCVGLATAYKILEEFPDVRLCLLEKEAKVAQHQTGNNSGVIHSGIYYAPGSLKAENCRRGYSLLLEYAEKNNIPYDLCGKIILATDEKEVKRLDSIHQRGIENGLSNLKVLDRKELKEKEPFAEGVQALHVPQTGIIDYKKVTQSLKKDIEKMGGEILLSTPFLDASMTKNGVDITTQSGVISTKFVVNSSGLFSDRIAKKILPSPIDYKILPFRGEYYHLKKEAFHLVKNLIYPVPDPVFPFLGVHFTRMISGGIEAGPNAVLAFKREGYSFFDVNSKDLIETLAFSGFRTVAKKYWKTGFQEMYRSLSKKAFVKSLQKLVPSIKEDHVYRGGAGIRAQACLENGTLVDDFLIHESEVAMSVGNAPSPAATSCLAIGENIKNRLKTKLT